MTARTKSIAIIIGTLLVGVIIGALATGAVFSQRVAELQALRNENGVSRFLENVIEPTDDAQKERIREILEKTSESHMEIRRSMMMQHRDVFQEMRAELSLVLTDEQKVQMREWFEKDRMKRPRLRPPGFAGPKGGEKRFQRMPPDSTGQRRAPWRMRERGAERVAPAPVEADSTIN